MNHMAYIYILNFGQRNFTLYDYTRVVSIHSFGNFAYFLEVEMFLLVYN